VTAVHQAKPSSRSQEWWDNLTGGGKSVGGQAYYYLERKL
jgi:hypothetical protein